MTLSDVSVVDAVCFSGSAELQLSAGGVPDPTSPRALLDPTETFFFFALGQGCYRDDEKSCFLSQNKL